MGQQVTDNDKAKHVGGISEELGGVDPQADENLMRLASIA